MSEQSKTEWTKGPWSVVYYDCGDRDYYDHNGPCPSIVAPDDQDCAIVHWDGFKQRYWSSANGRQSEIEANARLIAAAPDMAEALENARVSLIGIAGNMPNGAAKDEARRLRAEIELALRKARGEQA